MTLQGGRKRKADRDARRFVLLLVLFLALVAIALWLVERGSGVSYTRPAERSPLAGRALRIVQAEFGSGWLGSCMFRIVGRETGWTYDPRATNWRDLHADGSRGSFGLFQIGALHRDRGESVAAFASRMYSPWANAALAHRLYVRASLAPWGGAC